MDGACRHGLRRRRRPGDLLPYVHAGRHARALCPGGRAEPTGRGARPAVHAGCRGARRVDGADRGWRRAPQGRGRRRLLAGARRHAHRLRERPRDLGPGPGGGRGGPEARHGAGRAGQRDVGAGRDADRVHEQPGRPLLHRRRRCDVGHGALPRPGRVGGRLPGVEPRLPADRLPARAARAGPVPVRAPGGRGCPSRSASPTPPPARDARYGGRPKDAGACSAAWTRADSSSGARATGSSSRGSATGGSICTRSRRVAASPSR